MSIVAWIFAPAIVQDGLFVLVPGSDPVQELLTTHLLRMMLPAVVIFGPVSYTHLDVYKRQVQVVEPDFHPRFDARSRHYSYEIFCQPFRDPLREVFSWRVWPILRLELIQNAALDLIGEHDFKVRCV